MSTTPIESFVDWHRPNRRSNWRAIVARDTEDTVYRLLINTIRGGDKVYPARRRRPEYHSPRATPGLRKIFYTSSGAYSTPGANCRRTTWLLQMAGLTSLRFCV